MNPNTQTTTPRKDAEKFDPALRENAGFAEALERVKRIQSILDEFESPLKPVDASTEGKWKPTALTLRCQQGD